MKRSGGRRFYRPEDIEFIRGIKILLHREKHPIKDVQKLIRIRGHQSVVELGRSVERASKPKDIKETNLVPRRIKPVVKVTNPTPVATPKPEPTPAPEPVAEKPVPEEDGIIRRIVPFGKPKSSTEPAATEATASDPAMNEPITRILDVEAFQDDADDLSIPEIDAQSDPQPVYTPQTVPDDEPIREPVQEPVVAAAPEPDISDVDREKLETALDKLKSLRSRWEKYQA